jgi:transposase-like protein
MNNSFEQLEQLTSQLALEQKKLLINLLQSPVSGQSCLDVLTMYRDKASKCPHCQSQQIKRNGKANQRQRYFCHSCKKNFMSAYNTPFYRLRTPKKWLGYLECMINSLTIRRSAQDSQINKNTSFLW